MEIDESTIDELTSYLVANLKLQKRQPRSKFFYQSIPLCVIDAVFSVGTKYEATRNTIDHFCRFNNITTFRKDFETIPEINTQYSVMDFINDFKNLNPQILAKSVFANQQRTSPVNGILKAEAVMLFMNELAKSEIVYFQDLHLFTPDLEQRIKSIKGQKSGCSLQSFLFLTGIDDIIVPNRMVIRFLKNITGKNLSFEWCQYIVQRISSELVKFNIHLSPGEVNNAIWSYQRAF